MLRAPGDARSTTIAAMSSGSLTRCSGMLPCLAAGNVPWLFLSGEAAQKGRRRELRRLADQAIDRASSHDGLVWCEQAVQSLHHLELHLGCDGLSNAFPRIVKTAALPSPARMTACKRFSRGPRYFALD